MPADEGHAIGHSRRGPKPVVERDGRFYKCKSYDTVTPDFDAMSSLEVSMWMLRNTYPRGYSAPPSGIEGMGGAIGMVVR